MILAGLDEVGYGPVLGPLVVACCAVDLPGHSPPDLWEAWGRGRQQVALEERAEAALQR